MLNRKDFSYTYNTNGYMIQYKGENIGGVGTINQYKGRGRQRNQQLNSYKNQAERTINELIDNKGHKHMLENIRKIDSVNDKIVCKCQINELLDELYILTVEEEDRKLTDKENKRYLEIVEILQNNNIEIPFSIEI